MKSKYGSENYKIKRFPLLPEQETKKIFVIYDMNGRSVWQGDATDSVDAWKKCVKQMSKLDAL